MIIAAVGDFLADFDAVPVGDRQAAIDLSAPGPRVFAAAGLAISVACDLLIVVAGWPINVAAAGGFDPLFEAVPLGRTVNGIDVCTAQSLQIASAYWIADIRNRQIFNRVD
jgi:hypothetical protein